MHVAFLAKRNHLLHVRTNSLGLGHGGLHAVLYDDGRDQIAQQRIAMAGVASEFESCIAVAHDVLLAFGIRFFLGSSLISESRPGAADFTFMFSVSVGSWRSTESC